MQEAWESMVKDAAYCWCGEQGRCTQNFQGGAMQY